MRARAWWAAALAGAVAVLAGCGGTGGGSPAGTSSGTSVGDPVTGIVTVLAAASLTESFSTLGRRFESAHPGVRVVFSFGASSDLATQITQGAPGDVFAAASPATMDTVTRAGEARGDPQVFASNVLAIAVPPGNPARVAGLADLARPGVKVALCAVQVPCGAAATKLLAADGVVVRPVTLERDVKAALTKVELGEVDAALVYRTDVRAAGGKVTGIEIPDAAKAVNRYPIVVLSGAKNATAAQAFVDYVRSDAGRQVLGDAGFTLP
ncbi:MAG TPA: molybdate ABC transporter substrate-binding protein [Mycobacteriales bacterium]|nr:molybdate ABC transporter substrate-binding protein [Mycobacteriales bacterium]